VSHMYRNCRVDDRGGEFRRRAGGVPPQETSLADSCENGCQEHFDATGRDLWEGRELWEGKEQNCWTVNLIDASIVPRGRL
jgi:hypothetical protein